MAHKNQSQQEEFQEKQRYDKPSSQCWVDTFDADYFMGYRERIQGPRKLSEWSAKSLIVGPKATVVISVLRDRQIAMIRLPANRLIPDLTQCIGNAVFREVTVESSEE